MIITKQNRYTDVENKLVIASRERKGVGSKIGVANIL